MSPGLPRLSWVLGHPWVLLPLLWVCLSFAAVGATNTPGVRVIAVVGAPGEPEFGTNFLGQLRVWQEACARAGVPLSSLGADPSPATNDLDQLQALLDAESKEGAEELWLVLIGHGTFDGREAKFNLRGPDLSATNLALSLRPFTRPVVVINAASSSGPFLPALAASNRIVITATRSGNEQNFARFGQYFAGAILDPKSDIDKDGQTSLLEAFLSASTRVAEFYKREGRLASEHSLIDDNGDGLGTPANWFRGLRATKRPREKAAVDGLRAHQSHLLRSPEEIQLDPVRRARRDQLERDLARLRETKKDPPDEEYYRKLEALLLDLARVYESSPVQTQ